MLKPFLRKFRMIGLLGLLGLSLLMALVLVAGLFVGQALGRALNILLD